MRMGLGIDLEFCLIAGFHDRRLGSEDGLPASHMRRDLTVVFVVSVSQIVYELLGGANEGLARFLPFEKFGHGLLASLVLTVLDIGNRIVLARRDVLIGFNPVLDAREGVGGKLIVGIVQ